MATGVYIYREIAEPSPSLAAWLDARGQLYEVQDPKGKTHLYIDNDIPRDPDITEEIVGRKKSKIGDMEFPGLEGCTVGFALFAETVDDESGETTFDHIGTFRSLDRAEAAKKNIKITINPVISGAEPDETWTSMDVEIRNVDPEDDEA